MFLDRATTLIGRDERSSEHLDLLRGLAALSVFIAHSRSLFFIDFKGSTTEHPFAFLWYFITGFAAEPVMVFFVLSGFVIASGVIRQIRENRWSWPDYLNRRFTRIYVVLIPALLLCMFWDRLGMKLFGMEGIYGGNAAGSPVVTTPMALTHGSPGTLVLNLLFIQGIVFPHFSVIAHTFGTNSPLWSLRLEFWYYMILPLIMAAVWVKGAASKRLLLAALGIFLSLTIIGHPYRFAIWLLGGVVCFVPRMAFLKKPMAFSTATAAGLLLLVTAMALSRRETLPTMQGDTAIGIATMILVYIAMHDEARPGGGLYSRVARFLASLSYTLYLVHLPLVVFLHATLIHKERWELTTSSLVTFVALMIGVFIYAWVAYWLFEARTDVVRKWFQSKLGITRKSA